MSVEVLHGCDAGVTGVSIVEVVQPLSLLPVPEATAVTRIKLTSNVAQDLDMCAEGLRAVPPDAVLVGYGDAVVEGVELDDGRNSGVSVDEDLIIQTGNAYKEMQS